MTSKGDSLFRSKLPPGDTLLLGGELRIGYTTR